MSCASGAQVDGPLLIIKVEGVQFEVDPSAEIKPGDLYISERNQGPELLTCRIVSPKNHWIHPVEIAYSYNTWECFKVVRMLP